MYWLSPVPSMVTNNQEGQSDVSKCLFEYVFCPYAIPFLKTTSWYWNETALTAWKIIMIVIYQKLNFHINYDTTMLLRKVLYTEFSPVKIIFTKIRSINVSQTFWNTIFLATTLLGSTELVFSMPLLQDWFDLDGCQSNSWITWNWNTAEVICCIATWQKLYQLWRHTIQINYMRPHIYLKHLSWIESLLIIIAENILKHLKFCLRNKSSLFFFSPNFLIW